jgi:hypothetical protein
VPSVLLLEVAPPIVGVEELTRLSEDDEDIVHLTWGLELGIGKALDLSLLEVHAWYFQDSDEGEDSEVGCDLVEEWTYGDVILNHIWSGQYQTEYIDRVPFSSYREDA